ncbi:hypothetical protein [Streptomyces sp. NBC_00448]|uniref:hypothetical protein n=1 Tax=Streptomyces sp. NBC_00448 TaxID=2903652 RepID=UPI002E225EEC
MKAESFVAEVNPERSFGQFSVGDAPGDLQVATIPYAVHHFSQIPPTIHCAIGSDAVGRI